jgi:hypothetical protein
MHRRTVPIMRCTLIRAAVLGASLTALTFAAGGVGSAAQAHTRASAAPTGLLVRANSHAALPRHGGTVDSLNWSGYAVTPSGGDVTAVSSTLVVPTAGLIPPGFAATWAGIGGYTSGDSTLIQAGVGEQSLPTLPILGDQYYAWYELLPNTETQLTGCTGDANCTVTPGESISVTISLVSGTTWNIAMTDAGHWSWSQHVTYTSSKASAEWILEAPTVLVAQTVIAPVGTVAFGPTSTYTAGGLTQTIAQGNPTQIDLSPGVINEATPSALASNGQSFDDCAYAQTCATP